MEIYLDILLLENIVINYIILVVTAKLAKCRVPSLRLLLGAVIGASYVILILLPDMKIFITTIAKIFLSFLIIAAAFGHRKFSSYLKTLFTFYITTFIFGGAAFAFLYFYSDAGLIKNGVFFAAPRFLETKWTQLFFAIAFAGIATRVIWELLRQKYVKEKMLVHLMISFDKKVIVLYALVDSGNALHDPLTNMPVVVVEFDALKTILPEEIRKIFEEVGEDDLNGISLAISKSSWFTRFRMIPYTSLGRENGMLIGFRPDFIEIENENEKKDVSDVVVGIYNKSLSRNEKYRALLGPELI